MHKIVNRSVSTLLFPLQSNQIVPLRRNQSLPCCLKISSREILINHKTTVSIEINSNTVEGMSPTIGELLGDNDRFHQRYHHYYTRSNSKRKRHSRRKYRQSTSLQTFSKSPSIYPEISPDPSQFYSYSPVYHYAPHLNYPYWSNPSPCLICDAYQGWYSREMIPSISYSN